jgi:hypothetical protein
MDLIEGSETSANINQTLGIHPKIETVNLLYSLQFVVYALHVSAFWIVFLIDMIWYKTK